MFGLETVSDCHQRWWRCCTLLACKSGRAWLVQKRREGGCRTPPFSLNRSCIWKPDGERKLLKVESIEMFPCDKIPTKLLNKILRVTASRCELMEGKREHFWQQVKGTWFNCIIELNDTPALMLKHKCTPASHHRQAGDEPWLHASRKNQLLCSHHLIGNMGFCLMFFTEVRKLHLCFHSPLQTKRHVRFLLTVTCSKPRGGWRCVWTSLPGPQLPWAPTGASGQPC